LLVDSSTLKMEAVHSSETAAGNQQYELENNCSEMMPRIYPWTLSEEKQTPWPESESELYRLSDPRLSAKLVPTFAARMCHVVRAADPLLP
jgi:hypothetical protein